jgi:hypothetical protein
MLVEKSRQVVSNSPIRRPTEVSTQNLHFQVKCFFFFFSSAFSAICRRLNLWAVWGD